MGGDAERHAEYETAAEIAHERCFIGRALAPEVAYESARYTCERMLRSTPTSVRPLGGRRDTLYFAR